MRLQSEKKKTIINYYVCIETEEMEYQENQLSGDLFCLNRRLLRGRKVGTICHKYLVNSLLMVTPASKQSS